jgi:tetratricopeptide (TPR) repeat protein
VLRSRIKLLKSSLLAAAFSSFLIFNVFAQENSVDNKKNMQALQDAARFLQDGRRYLEKKKYDQAINAFEKAIKLDPQLGEGYFYLGLAYGKDGKLDKEIEFYCQALEFNPPCLKKVYLNLASAYAEKKDYAQAINNYRRALELDPNYAPALASLGMVILEKGNDTAALEQYQKLLALKREDLAVPLKDQIDRRKTEPADKKAIKK